MNRTRVELVAIAVKYDQLLTHAALLENKLTTERDARMKAEQAMWDAQEEVRRALALQSPVPEGEESRLDKTLIDSALENQFSQVRGQIHDWAAQSLEGVVAKPVAWRAWTFNANPETEEPMLFNEEPALTQREPLYLSPPAAKVDEGWQLVGYVDSDQLPFFALGDVAGAEITQNKEFESQVAIYIAGPAGEEG